MNPWIWFVACVPCICWNRGDKLKCMKKGQVLEVLTDYDGALEDIPDWCQKVRP